MTREYWPPAETSDCPANSSWPADSVFPPAEAEEACSAASELATAIVTTERNAATRRIRQRGFSTCPIRLICEPFCRSSALRLPRIWLSREAARAGSLPDVQPVDALV